MKWNVEHAVAIVDSRCCFIKFYPRFFLIFVKLKKKTLFIFYESSKKACEFAGMKPQYVTLDKKPTLLTISDRPEFEKKVHEI